METIRTAPVHNAAGERVGEMPLPAEIFAIPVHSGALHQAVVAYQANQRQGTASTRNRARVRGGGRKPWKQKGTGRARAGSIRSPLWRGGGTIFGPTPRDYRQGLPQRVRRLALRSALSAKAGEGRILLADTPEFARPSTKGMAAFVKACGCGEGKVLLLTRSPRRDLLLSGRNIPTLRLAVVRQVTAYDVLWADHVIVERGALAEWAGEREGDGSPPHHQAAPGH